MSMCDVSIGEVIRILSAACQETAYWGSALHPINSRYDLLAYRRA